MAINKFSIENAGAIEFAECDNIPNIMMVGGPNGVGKSTLFEEIRDLIQHGRSNNSIDISNETIQVYFSPHRVPSANNINETSLTQMNETSFVENLSDPGYNIGGGTNLPNEIRRHGRRSRSVADYAPYFDLKRRLAQLKRERAFLVEDILDREGEVEEMQVPDVSKYIQSAVEYLLPGISFDRVEKENNTYAVYFKNRTGDEVEFDELSSGERDAVSMAFSLVEYEIEKDIAEARQEQKQKDDIVMIIDSPEAYLHPSLQARLLDFLRDFIKRIEDESWELQVLMCTHSSIMLNNSPSSEVYFLVHPDQVDGNQLISAKNIDRDLLEIISGELGFTALSSGNPLLLVEGKSDIDILDQLHPNLQNNLEIIAMGGKHSIQHLNKAFNELIPELREMGVPVYAILDRDRDWNLDQEIEDYILVLPVTCIENLIVMRYRAIYNSLDILAGRSSLENNGVTSASDVESLIRDIIETTSFRDHEMIKRLNEELSIHIDLRELDKLTITEIQDLIDDISSKNKERISTHLEVVESSIDSAISNFNIAELDGKYLLGEIATKFDIRSDVLARTAANKIEPSNLPDEYTEFIEEINTKSNWQS